MRMRTVVLAAALIACEQADGHHRPIDLSQFVPKPPPRPAVALPAPRLAPEPPAPPPPPMPRPHRSAPERVPNEDDLPQPPSVQPQLYREWLAEQSGTDRHRIALFCRSERLDFHAVCGGIGPLHVPRPPMLVPLPYGEDPPQLDGAQPYRGTRGEWLAAMTLPQRQWVATTCDHFYNQGELCTVMTPLVVSFDDAPVKFVQGGTFPLLRGRAIATDWPTGDTPWIALDVDGDGAIGSGAELFGSDTAKDGFEALARLDANHDGRIDRDDPAFERLVLWSDRDHDRFSTADELRPLSSVVVSISLAARDAWRCDARDNCEGQRATLVWRDDTGATRTGSVVDVYLPFR
jgi:hypothetical protein